MHDGLHRKPHRDTGRYDAALKVMGSHVRYGRRDSIHRDIHKTTTLLPRHSPSGLPSRNVGHVFVFLVV